ncbi:MAG: hypothetical protein M0016_00195 [Deltaproteobacteria bacterium]|jgi:hypothetical protein|nr:hypothetical protein [Deltaproteobacteria bacterium]MCL5880267.1 hypothetical protein [Deltaproteobacteria bacterium]MDA8303581.1 hypothetical protein [Deltaproteobacteria bacterium]
MAESSKKLIYIDVCALCRPFDDQSLLRIRLETETVKWCGNPLSFCEMEDLK